MHVRVCRDCDEEYRLDAPITNCPDCGGEIVAREVRDKSSPSSETSDDEDDGLSDPGEELVPVHNVERSRDIEPFGAAFNEAGIPFRVSHSPFGFALMVRTSDRDRAEAALAPLLRTEHSEAAAAHFDAERGYQRCPACQTEITAGEPECAECGLKVGGFEPAPCARCGAKCASEDGPCASCGHN
jgi:hypothetical protein